MKSSDFDKEMMEPKTKRSGRNQQDILNLLMRNPGLAYTQTEIQEAIGAKHPSAVNYSLHALQARGEVRVRVVEGIQYWGYCNSQEKEETGEVNEDGGGKEAGGEIPRD